MGRMRPSPRFVSEIFLECSHARSVADCLWLLSSCRDMLRSCHRDRGVQKAKNMNCVPLTECAEPHSGRRWEERGPQRGARPVGATVGAARPLPPARLTLSRVEGPREAQGGQRSHPGLEAQGSWEDKGLRKPASRDLEPRTSGGPPLPLQAVRPHLVTRTGSSLRSFLPRWLMTSNSSLDP